MPVNSSSLPNAFPMQMPGMVVRRRRGGVAAFWLVAALSATSSAHAQQARDWMIAAQPSGTDAMLDLVFPGVQATLEHRAPIYGFSNQATLRANALYTVPFFESQADAELRILALTLGGSGGFRRDNHALTFEEDESLGRRKRRLRDIDGLYDTATYGYGEGRATLSLPINDYVLFNAINTLRFQDSPDRTFDWRQGVVHDGTTFRSDIMLFLKHRDWGGFAPMMQVLNFGLGENRFTQINYGFLAVTRPGFIRRGDIFFLQFLFHPGSTLGGYDNADSYGMHLFFAPITFTLAYRMVLPVWRPE
jgi:hypothetical protein